MKRGAPLIAVASLASASTALASGHLPDALGWMIAAIYGVPALLAWSMALLPLRGPPTIARAVVGLVGAMTAAIATALGVWLVAYGEGSLALGSVVLPGFVLVAHVGRLVMALRPRRAQGHESDRSRVA